MPTINVNLKGDGAWPDMGELREQGKLIIIPEEAAIDIAVLDDGTVSGEPSMAFRFYLPDGKGCLCTDHSETLSIERQSNSDKVSRI